MFFLCVGLGEHLYFTTVNSKTVVEIYGLCMCLRVYLFMCTCAVCVDAGLCICMSAFVSD